MTDVAQLISVGAMEIAARAQALGISWSMRMATVIENVVGSIVAQYDGDPKQINMATLIGPVPVAKRVYVLEVPPAGNYICGLVTEAPMALNVECTNVFGISPSGTTTSAAYVATPGLTTVPFVKVSDLSRLQIELNLTFFVTVAAAGISAGVSVGAIGDFDITKIPTTNSALLAHTHLGGDRILDPVNISGGIPAGPYTITGLWLRNSGAGTLNMDSGDIWSCTVTELPASIV